ncbi:MAG: T9SS type A sorting domain-containing protein [Bacteroidales bacterium]|nr:T9SS type A sorting domain-containing protein [Bacteroidales bacterium]
MKIIDFIVPTSCSLTTTEDITITIVNTGTSSQNNFSVQYSIDSGASFVNEVISPTIQSGDSLVYTFVNKADFSQLGKYNCIAVVHAIGDENTENDTSITSTISYPNIDTFPFIEKFELGDNLSFVEQSGEQAKILVNNQSANNSEFGLNFFGGDYNSGWQGGSNPDSINIWVQNTKFQASAYSCDIDVSSLLNPILQFDIRLMSQDYSNNSWFRVLINNIVQIKDINGDHTYNNNMTDFETKQFDLSAYAGNNFTLKFQSCCRIGSQDMVYIDNIVIGEPPIVNLGNDTAICENDTITLDAGAGVGYSYYWRKLPSPDIIGLNQHINITDAGTYHVDVYSDAGIISSDTIILIVNPSYYFVEQEFICNTDSLLWQGDYYLSEGTYYANYQTVNDCDSVYELNLTVNPKYFYTEQQTICDNGSLFWHGNYYDIPGTYYDSLSTVLGCDSIYEMQLIVNPTFFYTEQQNICENDSLLWRGNYYDIPGTYYDSLSTVMGCDSIYEMQLVVNPIFFYTEQYTICENDSLLWRGNYYDTSGTYCDSLNTVMGCDSVYEMQLVVNPTFFYSEQQTICNNDSLFWHQSYYNIQGTYYDSLQTVLGCDSIFELQLFVNPAFYFEDIMTTCNGNSVEWRGNYYSVSGIYYDSLQTTVGCDSVYALNLIITPNYYYSDVLNICEDSVLWHGDYYFTSGVYTDSLLTIAGCDSIFEVQINFNNSYYMVEYDSVCDDNYIYWHDMIINSTGVYYDNLETVQGCDSIFELNFTRNVSSFTEENISICENEQYFWHGIDYSTQGVYYDTLQATTGCDSIFKLSLQINPLPDTPEIWGPDTVNIGDTTLYWLPPFNLLDSWLVDNCIIVEYLDDFHIKVKWDTIGIAYVYASFKNHHECTDTTYKQIIVENGSGIGFINTSNINVYPNPTSGLITIEGQNIDLVEIVNVDGQIVKQCSENRKIYIMNLSSFSKGLYLIKITTSKGIINRKIVLE